MSGQPATHEEVAVGFEHVHPTARAIVAHGRDWKLLVPCDREPVNRWTETAPLCRGDAALPVMQNFAQGASVAMEDCVALAVALGADDDTQRALKTVQDMRLIRTARVRLNSRLIGDCIYHPVDAKADVRNAVIRGMMLQDLYDQLTWIDCTNGLPPGNGRI